MALRLVIVDDSASYRAAAKALLEFEGFEVVGEVETAAAALPAVRELAPDVVLLDVNLPDGKGPDVASSLRDGGVSSAIVLVSSKEDAVAGMSLEESGARGFIPKAELNGERLMALVG